MGFIKREPYRNEERAKELEGELRLYHGQLKREHFECDEDFYEYKLFHMWEIEIIKRDYSNSRFRYKNCFISPIGELTKEELLAFWKEISLRKIWETRTVKESIYEFVDEKIFQDQNKDRISVGKEK